MRKDIIIVNNPKQKGAMDGVVAICEALKSFDPNMDYSFVYSINDVKETPYILWSVGPDTTDIAIDIIEKYKPDFVFGMKDPYDDEDIEKYRLYNKIIDTMGTLKTAKITKHNPDLVYFPDFPPFSLTKKMLYERKSDEVLKLFEPDLLVSIGGADPYTNRDVIFDDIDNLLWLAEDFKKNIGGKVAFLTSNRTSPGVLDYLLVKKQREDAAVDFKSGNMCINDEKYENINNVYISFVSVAQYLVQTDDSLSMMAELTVPEKKLIIYQTCGTDETTQRRIDVSRQIEMQAGAKILASDEVCLIKSGGDFFKDIKNTRSLEGIVDMKIAQMIYDIIKS